MKKILFLFLLGLIFTNINLFSQIPGYIPTNGLKGYYSFDGNANDQSENGHNGTVNGAILTNDRNGKPNKAYSFDGINDFIGFGNWFNYSSFSISMWVKPDDQNGHAVLIDNYHSDNNNFVCQAIANWQTNGYNFCNSSDFYLMKDNWTHLVLVYSSGQAKVYLNGILVSQTNWTLNYNNPPSLNLGYWQPVNDRFWKGFIDEVGFWDRALTEQEISNIFNPLPKNIPQNGLIGYWPFNGNADDESGNNLHGNVIRATLTNDRYGKSNSAYNFDYSTAVFSQQNQEIYIPYNPILNVSNITVSYWIYARQYYWSGNPSLTVNITRFQYGYSIPNGQVWGIGYTDNQIIGNLNGPNGDGDYQAIYNNAINLNSWNNIVMTYDGAVIKLYLNAQLISTKQHNLPMNITGNSGISIGENNSANGFWQYTDGIIDDLGIWDRALTEQEIVNLLDENILAPEPTRQSKDIRVWKITKNSIGIRWTKGNGENRAVVASEYALNSDKYVADGTNYTASEFGVNQANTPDSYVVYNGNSNTCEITNLQNNKLYFFRIFDYNGTGSNTNYLTTSERSNPNSRMTLRKESEEWEETIVGFSLNIYPNPAKDFINIEMNLPFEGGELIIANNEGREVYKSNDLTSLMKLGTSSFVNGTYHILISNGDEAIYNSFVIER